MRSSSPWLAAARPLGHPWPRVLRLAACPPLPPAFHGRRISSGTTPLEKARPGGLHGRQQSGGGYATGRLRPPPFANARAGPRASRPRSAARVCGSGDSPFCCWLSANVSRDLPVERVCGSSPLEARACAATFKRNINFTEKQHSCLLPR